MYNTGNNKKKKKARSFKTAHGNLIGIMCAEMKPQTGARSMYMRESLVM